MKQPGIILIGAGGHAHSCIEVIERQDKFQIVGLIGMPEEIAATHLGYPVIGTDRELPELVKIFQCAHVSVGQIRSPDGRIRLFQHASELGFQFPAIIAASALVSPHANIGAGTIVMQGAIVNAGVTVGKNCIINTRALLEHDVEVEDHCHISTGAILNGNVKVGMGTFVGSGSVIKEGVTLGQRSIVGMGLTVRHDLPDFSQFKGHNRT